METLESIEQRALQALELAVDEAALDAVRVQYLGKSGELTTLLKSVGNLPPAERPLLGQAVNRVKAQLQLVIDERQTQLDAIKRAQQLDSERIDITLPARGHAPGHWHPITQTRYQIENFFLSLGYSIVTGPEIEDEDHNFTALNIPETHPARGMMDTFYVDIAENTVLRTHTSSVQIRHMEQHQPPFRIIAPGRAFRKDDIDMTHVPAFHQVEGLVIEPGIGMPDLKGTLMAFLRYFFAENVNMRFRASFFPFTEPSAEVDISCLSCQQTGCRVCKFSGWLEVLGCGLVHPKVLKDRGIDPDVYTGFAFGMGIERLAMLRWGIDDLRDCYSNDWRFLAQF